MFVDSLKLEDSDHVSRLVGRRHDLLLEFSSQLRAPTAGTYRFTLSSKDRAVLRIDGKTVLDLTGSATAEVALDEGIHRFRLRYRQMGGPGFLDLVWDRPAFVELLPIEHYLAVRGERLSGSHLRRRELEAASTFLLALLWWFGVSRLAVRAGSLARTWRLSRHASPHRESQRRLLRQFFLPALVVLQVVIYVTLIEFITSFFTTIPSGNTVKHYRLHHVWPPNTTRTRIGREYDRPYIHYFNRQGWMETYDIAPKKPSNTYRIFYVGDSFTAGTVPMDQSVPSIVEERLNGLDLDTGTHFEVINTGTTSYSPIIHYVLIKHFITSYSPDLIVINVDMTDDFDDWKYRPDLVVDSDGNPWAVPPRDIHDQAYVDTEHGFMRATWLTKVTLFLYENSYSYNYLRDRLRASTPQERVQIEPTIDESDASTRTYLYRRWSWCRDEWDDLTMENVRFTMDTLKRIAKYCHDKGIKLLLTGVPHYNQLTVDKDGKAIWSRRPHLELERVADETGVAYFDSCAELAPAVSGTPRSEYYSKNDMHFNARGYRLWSDAHFEALTNPEKSLLPANAYE